MVLRTRDEIAFCLNGDENIILLDLSHVCNLVHIFKDGEYELSEVLIPYNFVLGIAVISNTKMTKFNGLIFQSIYHIDEYIRESPNDIQLMIDFISIFR